MHHPSVLLGIAFCLTASAAAQKPPSPRHAECFVFGRETLRYSADTFERDVETFWLNGDLVVTPIEQVAFVERLVLGTLPLSRAHMTTVMDAMRMPAGQVLMAAGPHPFALAWPPQTIVRTKTGNTTVGGERVSWLIGAVELRNIHYVFAPACGPLARCQGRQVLISRYAS